MQGFKYISSLVTEFFDDETVQDRLYCIKEKDIKGWELWLHIELAIFLNNHESSPVHSREERILFDRRRERERSFMRPDFIIQNPNQGLGRMILEIKQGRSINECINSMWGDLKKVAAAKQSHAKMESFWLLGIFPVEDGWSKHKLSREVNQAIQECGGLADPNLKNCSRIGNTGMGYVLF